MYAVFNTQTGLKGIYYDWKEASDAFNGIKGAKAKKFYTLEESQDWLEGQQGFYDEQRKQEHIQSPGGEQEETTRTETGWSGASPSSYQKGPPNILLGADPSLKDSEKVYGVDVSTGKAEFI
jgi:hypothetical protein